MSRVYCEGVSGLAGSLNVRTFYKDPSRKATLAIVGPLPKAISSYVDHLCVFTVDGNDYVSTASHHPTGRTIVGALFLTLELCTLATSGKLLHAYPTKLLIATFAEDSWKKTQFLDISIQLQYNTVMRLQVFSIS